MSRAALISFAVFIIAGLFSMWFLSLLESNDVKMIMALLMGWASGTIALCIYGMID